LTPWEYLNKKDTVQDMPDKKSKQRMIKTSIDLPVDHYHFLKTKALDRKIRGEDPSIVTIIRELIEEDRKKWK